jgi:DNA polymerase III sliding clamp (beta) subunit (PCNA family)
MSLEIEIPVAELKQVLPGFTKIINKSSSLPALGCVRASVVDGQIQLQATNLDDTATVNMGPCGSGSGAMLVPFEELNKVVKGCATTDSVRLCTKTNEAIINYPIGSNRVDRRLSFIDPKDWPTSPVVNDSGIPVTDKLKEALQNAFECASDDSSRYVLQSAFLDTRDAKAHYVVGTNGRILFSANSFQFGLKESLIVPNRKFLHWRGFLEDGDCQLSSQPPVNPDPQIKGKERCQPGYVQFKSNRWTFITRQIEGEYPNWKQVLPNEFKTAVTFSDEAMQFVLSAIPKMPCTDSRNQAIQLVVQESGVSLQAWETESKTWTTIPVDGAVVNGDPITVTMNRTYLAQAMRLGLHELQLTDTLSPFVFRKDGRRLVVMGIRTEGPEKADQEPNEVSKPSESTSAVPTQEASQAPEQIQENQTQERKTMPEPDTQKESNTSKISNVDKTQKSQSAHDLLLEMVEGIRTHLKGVVSDLNDLSKTVSQAYREKRATDKEIESIRESLNEIRKLRI